MKVSKKSNDKNVTKDNSILQKLSNFFNILSYYIIKKLV
jgi:hypothetical protein